MRKKKPPVKTFPCPHCGAAVKQSAVACRECGSDMATGWQDDEEIDYQSLALPEGWSQDPEHPSQLPPRGQQRAWVVVTALLLVAVLVWWAIGGR